MSITLNTYGLRSINTASFNAKGARDTNGNLTENIPVATRDLINTILRINNLTFNILGYIPGVQQISGCVRIGIGGSIVLLTVALGSSTGQNGAIVGRWYDEALLTGIAQITRGTLEACVPFGSLINLSLDGIGTMCNLSVEVSNAPYHGDGPLDKAETVEIIRGEQMRRQQPPYSDLSYPFFLSFLYWA